MRAMILAAGLGTRLRPWTLTHPKALVPVGGVPMLERVIGKLRSEGFSDVVVNVHHFADQIVDFLSSKDFGVRIEISDERDELLDTGGAIVHARHLLKPEEGPVLIHNVDILSNASLGDLMRRHVAAGSDSTLLVSDRDSSRKLIFDDCKRLVGWHNIKEDRYRPTSFRPGISDREYAFSGIHVVGEKLIEEMLGKEGDRKFSIIDFLLRQDLESKVNGEVAESLRLIDIGKPATLSQAQLEV